MEERLSLKGSIGVLPTGAILSSIYVPLPSPSATSIQNLPFAANREGASNLSIVDREVLPNSRPTSPLVNQEHLYTPPAHEHSGAHLAFIGSQHFSPSAQMSSAQSNSFNAGCSEILDLGGVRDVYYASRSPSPGLNNHFTDQSVTEQSKQRDTLYSNVFSLTLNRQDSL